MSHSQFHCTGRVYLDLHGLIFETSICYWQDQPGSPPISHTPHEERVGLRWGPAAPGTEVPGRAERSVVPLGSKRGFG